MARFKVVTPEGVSFGPPGVGYEGEMEALGPIGAEIVEIPAGTEDEFVKAARNADALYAKVRRITKRMIDGMERCKIISLGSVGVDSVDVAAATARGIPVTNVPDTFIEEVADHAHDADPRHVPPARRQDRMVREGRWKEGRPQLSQFPRLMGPDARASSPSGTWRARWRCGRGRSASGCSPTIPTSTRLVMSPHGVEPVGLERAAAPLGHRLHARAGHGRRHSIS